MCVNTWWLHQCYCVNHIYKTINLDSFGVMTGITHGKFDKINAGLIKGKQMREGGQEGTIM